MKDSQVLRILVQISPPHLHYQTQRFLLLQHQNSRFNCLSEVLQAYSGVSCRISPRPTFPTLEEYLLEAKLMMLERSSPRTSCKLYWKNEICSADRITPLIEQDTVATTEDYKNIYSLLNLNTAPNTSGLTDLTEMGKETVLTLKSLASKGEGYVQERLLNEWRSIKGMHVVDTHTTAQGFPAYKFPSNSDQTTKPNFASAVCPMFLDLKAGNPFKVLSKAIERVHVTMIGNETICNSLAFAIDEEKAWVFFAKRDLHQIFAGVCHGGKILESYYIFPINFDWIFPLWFEFSCFAAVDPEKSFIMREAYPLASVVRDLGYDPRCCIMKILYISGETWIFECTPAVSQFKILPPRSRKNSFIIKLSSSFHQNYDLDQASNELTVLQTLKDTKEVDYVIALCDSSRRKPVTWFKEKALPQPYCDTSTATFEKEELSSTGVHSHQYYWWDYSLPSSLNLHRYIAVIMYCGQVAKRVSMEDCLSLTVSLALIHTKNVLHCDLRPPNIMKFEINGKIKPYIIDFNLAVILKDGQKDTVIDLHTSGGQRSAIQKVLSEPIQNDQVCWNSDLDFRVLRETVHKLSQPTNSFVISAIPSRSQPWVLIPSLSSHPAPTATVSKEKSEAPRKGVKESITSLKKDTFKKDTPKKKIKKVDTTTRTEKPTGASVPMEGQQQQPQES